MKSKFLAVMSILPLLFSCAQNGSSNPPEAEVATLTSISITPPAKTSYKVGESLSLDGMVVTATYSDSGTKTISNSEVSTSGFDSSKVTAIQVITVTYEGKTATFTISISESVKTLSSISVTPPSKLEYQEGESLNTSGMVVKAIYSDGSDTTLSSSDYTVTGYNSLLIGKQTITVSYQNKTATFEVEVIDDSGEHEQPVDPISPVKPINQVKAEKVYITYSATSVAVNNKYYISPVVMPNDAYKNVKYIVEDPNVVEIEGDFATAKTVGQTLVKAYNDENDNDAFDSDEAFTMMAISSTANPDDSSISVTQDINLTVGDTFKPTVTGNNITLNPNSLGYYSTDESIADYANGNIVANKSGECDIYVKSGDFYGYSHVTVKDKVTDNKTLASDVYATNKLMRVTRGGSKPISYTLYPSSASSDTPVFFSSTNNNIVEVREGQIYGKNVGTALVNISLSKNGYPVESIRVDVIKADTTYEDNYYNNYYGDLTWENGEDLRAKLKAIISQNKTSLNYGSPVNWETNSNADHDLYDFSLMASIYGRNNILKSDTQKGWQREHAFCASLMTNTTTGNAVKTLGRATDFHNLYAADASGNQSRGNKNLGNANTTAPDYTDRGTYHYTRKWFSPKADEDKGKLARAIFYMAVMYDDVEHSSFTESSRTIEVDMPGLNIINDNVGYSRLSQAKLISPDTPEATTISNYYKNLALSENSSLSSDAALERGYELYLQNALPYSIGGLSDLLDWNTYSVGQEEMHHNESVYGYTSTAGKGKQGNRNPFVDYPELVEYIFGELRFTPGSLKDLRPSSVALEMNKNETHHYALGDKVKKTYNVGDIISVTDLDLKKVGYDLSINAASASDLLNTITFTDSDVGTKEITIQTPINNITMKVTVSDGSSTDTGNPNYQKATSFDVSKTYYLSPDGTTFAKANITNQALTFSSADADFGAITFTPTDKQDEYNITITNGTTSIKLGYSGSGTYIKNADSNWKIITHSDGGLVLQEVSSSRKLGMMGAADTRARLYTSFSSSNVPVYLFISK